MSSWFDPETKALLAELPPTKLAPPDTAAFTLVILDVWRRAPQRIARSLRRVGAKADLVTAAHLHEKVPLAIQHGLGYSDALLAQFELVSCDVVSVFISDTVFQNAEPAYLADLFGSLLRSDEFTKTAVRINDLPKHPRVDEYVEQFLGGSSELGQTLIVPYKKARIMDHWLHKMGGTMWIRPLHG